MMTEALPERFDYIVIGAGSVGCALAAPLAEDGRTSVLLLEAGGRDWRPEIHASAGIVRLIGNPRFDWAHLAEPDPSRDRKVDLWPAGKVLSGSSSINGMLHVRGAPAISRRGPRRAHAGGATSTSCARRRSSAITRAAPAAWATAAPSMRGSGCAGSTASGSPTPA